ncbi:phosphomannomutase/phosphoglucomutase [Reinekea marinisedimentorum]|uniref:phosphomannomutase n=1 Tax=Reinekea marinisedimentorum TaxID=230495 RepID=A0A4R3IBG2_9GAMM|nr:phosphomannomutase/phosphoglucomutase [Reinekea marinisedimentorum]TCS43960.1 phosphomannomutase/phosphoglucomutase [Reinekea marinisedimentorum]
MAKKKANKANEPTKKKSTKKKAAPKKQTGQGNRSILSFLYMPIVIATLCVAAIGYFLISFYAAPVDQHHRQQLVNAVAETYEAYVNNVLAEKNTLLNQIAQSAEVVSLIEQGDEELLLRAESRIAAQIPYGLTVHLSPLRGALMQNDTFPPLSHAGLDMIRRAEQGQNPATEAHQYDGTAYLQSVKAVRDSEGTLIGTLAVTQSLDYLKNQLGGIDARKGNLLIQQQFPGAPKQTLVTYGTKNRNQVMQLQSSNPNWTLTFQPADELALSSILNANMLWLHFGALIVLVCLPIFVAAQRLQATLRKDANSFARQVQNMLAGKGAVSVDYDFAIFTSLAKALNRMQMGKFTPGNGPTIIDSAMGRPNMAEIQQDVDVSMIESDADLLGISEASSTVAAHVDVDESIFGAYSIAGVVGQTLTLDSAMQIGQAIGSEAYDRGEQSVIVARDGRLSSSEISHALIKGLVASGRDVVDIGETAAPVCSFASEHLQISSSVMVTGDYLDSTYNGFKVVLGGAALTGNEIKGLYHRIQNQNFLTGEGKINNQKTDDAYLSRVSEDVSAARPLKVVVDCGNGVSGVVAPQLIKGVGCHVLPLFCNIDGNFPNHLPNPSNPKNLQELTRTVIETRADLGIAFDNSGDRLAVVSNSGQIISADKLMMLLAKQVVQKNPGATVLYDVKSTFRLKALISGYGGKPVMCPSGHPQIRRSIKENNAALAGEMSGHFFYSDRWYGFEDGFYTACRLLELLSQQSETLDTLLSELPPDISTPEIRIAASDERKQKVIEALESRGEFGVGQVSNVDGIRVEFRDGWGVVRASRSTSNLSCRFEAESEEALRKIQSLFKQQLQAVDRQLQIPF